MADLTKADMIWNRACGGHTLRALPGDRALADLLRAHGLAMNGGVLHAVECLTPSQIAAAQSGYRFFGLEALAALLGRARRILEAGKALEHHERQLDRQYAELVPSDSSLMECFKARLASEPAAFAELRVQD
jgi:hypothetical protein